MSTAKHTPGPWSTYFNKEADITIRKMFPDGTECCAIARCSTSFADARLIAAAPQQHDALLAVLHAPGFSGLDEATKNAVRAAIATGDSAALGKPITDSRCEYLYWPNGRCDKCGNVHDGKLPGVAAGLSKPWN